jgi:hypothetical protein
LVLFLWEKYTGHYPKNNIMDQLAVKRQGIRVQKHSKDREKMGEKGKS